MSGTFASIEKKTIENGTCLAHKTYSKFHGKLVLQHYKKELWALKKLQVTDKDSSVKNHVIQLVDSRETSDCYQLVFPFYNSTLQDHFGSKKLTLGHDFLLQISKGLFYLHNNDIIHCDLSPSNIMIDDLSGNMFICDFGCAHSISEKELVAQEEIGTRYYKAPEHLFGSKIYAPSTDVWSLGAIFAQLLIGYPVFAGESDIEQIGRVVNRLGRPSVKVEQEEMSNYPDANKLMFFTGGGSSDDEYEFESDDEDIKVIMESKIPIEEIVEDFDTIDKQIILGILTWSIKDRLTIPKIIELIKDH